jgi:hypothetical protein
VAGGDDAFLGQDIPYTEAVGPTPMAQQWSLSLQWQLLGRRLVDVTYSANKGTRFIGPSTITMTSSPSTYRSGAHSRTPYPIPTREGSPAA